MEFAMTYLVTRIATGRWQLTSPEGTNLGVMSKGEALATGRLLAGWRGRVVVEA
jgi:hypothetical protein